ncbi:flagellar filament capping protein FliD [Heliobacterium chlorum]|uniref:Flagellar filament capping protein FliD n=1 Tax=Heliobacterium chlorum TaxID=2698 RepID=A0ABR7T363_HELCL|nr:flagellar filament capping protein FliD [Heliobacterium chlorum]MBC9784647.1 flagellar filament capping protein FliD [Heliobacterium chlorum]
MIRTVGYFGGINSIRKPPSIYAPTGSTARFNPYNYYDPYSSLDSLKNKVTSALRDTRDRFIELGSKADQLTFNKAGNVFDKRVVDTGGSTAFTGTAVDKTTASTYKVGVTQVAVAQQNQGAQMQSSTMAATAGFAIQKNVFALNINGKTHTLTADIGNSDTIKTALQKMATSINEANTGITAKVVDTTSVGVTKSQIVLTANKTGTDNTFTINDVQGNLVANSGAHIKTTSAQDAKYTVNGTPITSQGNTVSLNGGKISLTLKAVTNQDVTVKVGQDTAAIKSAINDLVTVYNKTVNTLKDNQDVVKGSFLQNMASAVKENRLNLEDIGIDVRTDGSLAVDAAKLSDALTDHPDRVKRTIGDYGGFAYKEGQLAKGISSMPLTSFTNAATLRSDSGTQNWMIQQQLNSYQMNANPLLYYSLTNSSGMFYNGYF